MGGLLRVVAVLIGAVLVLGGGVCTLVGIPTGLISLFSGTAGAGLSILVATGIGFGCLRLGLWMVKLGQEPKP